MESKKKSCEISRGLGFWPWNFRGINVHDFTKFLGVEFCFTWNFQEVQRKIKTVPGVFSKKNDVFNPPSPAHPALCWVFSSGIAHSKIIDLKWSYEALAQNEALTRSEDRAFASFSCVLSLYIVRFRRVHRSVLWYQLIGSEEHPHMWSKAPPSLSHFQYM